jgi:Bacterial mobilisation protein (MobC)
MAEKLNTSLKIRLSQPEKLSWQEKAVLAGVPLSTLIREAMSRTRTWTASDRSSLQEQTRQISRIGNNLNQIAKWANTYKSTAEAIEIIEALRAIEQALTQLSTNPSSSSFPSAPTPEAKQDVT